MQRTKTSTLLRLTFIILILSLAFSVFTGCAGDREMASKESITEAIESVTERDAGYQYVHLYLSDMGIANFSVSKMLWAEIRFQAYFNLESGLPKTNEHARMTAERFVSDYYDKINVADAGAVTDALIACYVDVIGDQFSVYRTPVEHTAYDDNMSGEFGGIGVIIEYDHSNETLRVSSVYIDSPAEGAGIRPGDYIIGVNGKSVEEIGYLNAVDYVRGKIGTDVIVTVKRGDATLDFSMKRAKVAEKTVDYEILENDIGFVQISGFKSNTFDQFVEAVDHLEEKNVKGIIFDLRGNPGGFVAVVCDMVSYILPNGKAIVSYQYKGSETTMLQSETDIHPTKKDPKDPDKPLESDHYITVPMVVLCDELTASASEMFTAALRDHSKTGLIDVTTVGHTTYGKGIMQSSWPYFDGSSVTITVAYYSPPCGQNYHGIGITPDRIIDNEIVDGFLVDRQLEAAIEEMNSLINTN